MGVPFDHYISRAHLRQWARDHRVTMMHRGGKPQLIEVGKKVAAEQGLNDAALEAAYGKVEDAFRRALRRLLDFSSVPTGTDWRAVREYAVLMHDRYPALRGSASHEYGAAGGNIMMVPNPANWGSAQGASESLSRVATTMDRELLKKTRLQLLPVNAQLLPRVAQVFRVGPMLLGDAGVHAIMLSPDAETTRAFVAMPLSSDAMIVFGSQHADDHEVSEIARVLTMKVAVESTVVIDTPEAPLISSLVAEMWAYQPEPLGAGLPQAIRVFDRLEDIPEK